MAHILRQCQLLGLLLGIIAVAGCNQPRKGALSPQVRTEIQVLAFSGQSAPMKYKSLAGSMATLLSEALAFKSDAAVMEHLRAFYAENSLALDLLEAEFQTWFREATLWELTEFLTALNQQQYAQDLRKSRQAIRRRLAYNPGYLAEFDRLTRCLEFRR